jgi:hypothetical protein
MLLVERQVYVSLTIRLVLSCSCNPFTNLKIDLREGPDMTEGLKTSPMSFQAISQVDVPKGREGKHKKIISKLLSDIEQLAPGTALKVPLNKLPDTKENIRSALNRATRQRGMEVATSSDESYLYIWNSEPQP